MEKLFELDVFVYGYCVPIIAHMNEETGRAYHLSCNADDETFEILKNFKHTVRRKDHRGNEREHDARMCASSISSSYNANFRIELSDVHIPFKDICYSCAFVAYDAGVDEIDFNDERVISNAIANL